MTRKNLKQKIEEYIELTAHAALSGGLVVLVFVLFVLTIKILKVGC